MIYKARIDSLISLPERLVRLVVDFDDGIILDYAKNEIPDFFEIEYTSIGNKNITLSAFISPDISKVPITKTFHNLVHVVNEYDNVDEELYSKHSLVFDPPYSVQPRILPNEWLTSETFNKTILNLSENLTYMQHKTLYYQPDNIEFIGWYGIDGLEGALNCGSGNWTWSRAQYNFSRATWAMMVSDNEVDSPFMLCSTWDAAKCGLPAPKRHVHNWKWQDVECVEDAYEPVKWDQLVDTNFESGYKDSSLWADLVCNFYTNVFTASTDVINNVIVDLMARSQLIDNDDCMFGARWHVNVESLSSFVNDLPCVAFNTNCVYKDMFVKDEILFVATSTQIQTSQTDLISTPILPFIGGIDKDIAFSKITAIASGIEDRVYVCDQGNNGVACFFYKKNHIDKWGKAFVMHGLGAAQSKYKFNNPTDLVIDNYSNVFVNDYGNSCIKMYTARGEWLRTVTFSEAPISLTVDSTNNVHLLYKTRVDIYSIIQDKIIDSYKISVVDQPVRIRTNFNKEIIYICTSTSVVRYFRTGLIFSKMLLDQVCAKNIINVYHDSHRNFYVLTNDFIVKYIDTMVVDSTTNNLAAQYWNTNEMCIKPSEFVQDWVYNKCFQRMWDNIELFRASLIYKYSNTCNEYTLPMYTKEQIFIGQNEIVSSAVINRCLNYLWVNLTSLYKYFNNTCS